MTPYSPEQLTLRLETAFDVEFSFPEGDHLVDILVPFDRDTQGFIPGWVERIASTNTKSATNSPAAWRRRPTASTAA